MQQRMSNMRSNSAAIDKLSWARLIGLANTAGISFETIIQPKPAIIVCPMYEADKVAGSPRHSITRLWFDSQQGRPQWSQYHSSHTYRDYTNNWVNAHKRSKNAVVVFPEELFRIAKEHAQKKKIPFVWKLSKLRFPK